ncbi:MAG: zinc-binding dehydrogenase [Acidimicrobiia bacterium]
MRAVRMVESGKPLIEEDVEVPRVGPHDVEVRIEAAGICRSDVHYRAGTRPVPSFPLTPGHEVAGTVSATGSHVKRLELGDRVAIHYLISCGVCEPCLGGREQFCEPGLMIGLDRDGGYAEAITVPERNAFSIPDAIPVEVAAIMMCSSATSLHALRRGRMKPGDTVAVIGVGGLGISAIKIAFALGASEVFAVDTNPEKLKIARGLGATPVPVHKVRTIGADVALELVGLPETMRGAVDALGVRGRAVAVGLTHEPFPLHSFDDLVLREAEVIGAADHLASDIEELIEMVGTGVIDLSDVVTATVPLEAGAINDALDRLETFDGGLRTVIKPQEAVPVPTSH